MNPETHRSHRALLYLFFALLFLLMLALSFLTPLVADDFSYSFSWADDSRIRSLGQIGDSMAVHRQLTNGRVLTHGLVQLLLMLPKGVFNLLNAGNTLLLAFLFLRHFPAEDGRRGAFLLLTGAFLIWNFLPVFGQTFLWLDGAVNYSWGISLFLLFLWPYTARYLELPRKASVLGKVLFFPLAFAAGAWSENGSVATLFIALCLLLLLLHREKKLPALLTAGFLTACLGFVFLMSAPAMQGRASDFSLSAIGANMVQILSLARSLLLPLYLLYATALALCLLAGGDRKKVLLSAVFFLAGLGSLSSFFFAVYFAQRHFCFTVLFTVLAILLLLSALLENGKRLFPALLAAGLAVLFVFNFSLGLLDIGATYLQSRERAAAIAAAKAAGEQEIWLEVYLPATGYSAPYLLTDLEPESDLWPNDSMARYYGLEAIHGQYPEE